MPWSAPARAATRGGNQSITSDRADTDSRVMSYDKVWVKHIKAALMENRFRLVQQPIASLQGDDPGMFDVLVRMIDTAGQGGAALGVHGRRRAQRPAEEHRPLGGRRLAVLRRAEASPSACSCASRARPPATPASSTGSTITCAPAAPSRKRLCFQVTEEAAAQPRPGGEGTGRARCASGASASRSRASAPGATAPACSSRCRWTS